MTYSIRELSTRVTNDFMSDVEETILCCMSAGVPIDSIKIDKELVFAGHMAKTIWTIRFKPLVEQ